MALFQYQSRAEVLGPIPPPPVSIDGWGPAYPKGIRTVTTVSGSATFAPVAATPETVTVDRWLESWPQPERRVRYAAGTSHVGPVSTTTTAVLTPLSWA